MALTTNTSILERLMYLSLTTFLSHFKIPIQQQPIELYFSLFSFSIIDSRVRTIKSSKKGVVNRHTHDESIRFLDWLRITETVFIFNIHVVEWILPDHFLNNKEAYLLFYLQTLNSVCNSLHADVHRCLRLLSVLAWNTLDIINSTFILNSYLC